MLSWVHSFLLPRCLRQWCKTRFILPWNTDHMGHIVNAWCAWNIKSYLNSKKNKNQEACSWLKRHFLYKLTLYSCLLCAKSQKLCGFEKLFLPRQPLMACCLCVNYFISLVWVIKLSTLAVFHTGSLGRNPETLCLVKSAPLTCGCYSKLVKSPSSPHMSIFQLPLWLPPSSSRPYRHSP